MFSSAPFQSTVYFCVAVAFLALQTGLAKEEIPAKAAEGQPLHVFSWEKPAPGAENISGFIWIDLSDDPNARHPNALSPEQAAEASRQLPKGCASIFIWKGHDVIGHPEDAARTPDGKLTTFASPWMEHGVAQVKERVVKFFTAFQKAGGKLDYLVLDYEGGLSNWCMKPGQVDAILADPRAEALKAKVGFDSSKALNDCSPPPYEMGDDIAAVVAKGDKPYMKWNRTMYAMLCKAMNEALYVPVHELFPKARASNYGMGTISMANPVFDVNGHLDAGMEGWFGNRGSSAFYGYRQLRSRHLKGGGEYGTAPMQVVRFLINTMRAYRRSTDVPFSPWVCHKSWTGDEAFTYALGDNDYYQEMIYHLALMDADDILYWNPAPWDPKQTLKEMRKESDDLLLGACVRVLNEKFGKKPRQCITLQEIAWDSDLLVSGTKIGDRILWRVTVPNWHAKVKAMPGGEILTTGKFLGLWYETPVGEKVTFELVK